MRPVVVALALAVLQLFRGVPPTTDQVFSLFGSYLESLRAQAGIPALSAVVVGDSGIAWEQAFGYQDIERLVGARTDTPFHVDGLTEMFTAALVLRCVELGRLSLDERIGQFDATSPEAGTTIRDILSETATTTSDGTTFAYRPDRLVALALPIRKCAGDDSFRESLSNLMDRLAMIESVPGADAVQLVPPALGALDRTHLERYTQLLTRLAVPYTVDGRGRPSPSPIATTTLTPSDGLISTAHDLARFDVALKNGLIVRQETLDAAWQPVRAQDGRALPHGIGWFVQTYNNQTVVWQFGVMKNAYSSLVIMLPARRVTLILLANSDGLARPAAIASGDVTASPFATVFLQLVAK